MAAWLSTAAVAATVGGIVALPSLLAADSGGNGATDHNRPAAATDPVVRNGDTVTGTGRVVAVAGQPVRFCAPVPVPMPAYAPGHEPPISSCPTFGVEVSGVSLAGLGRRHHRGAAVEGYATLTGTYRAGSLTVTGQSPADGPSARKPGSVPEHLPCAAPPGGWLPGSDHLDVSRAQAYADAHSGEVVQLSLQRPAVGRTVLVLATRHPGAVRAVLAPSYGRRMCLFRSPYTAGQLDAAHERLGDLVASSDLFEGGGVGVGVNGLPEVSGGAVILTTQLADVAGEFPPGLVRFDAWLTKTG